MEDEVNVMKDEVNFMKDEVNVEVNVMEDKVNTMEDAVKDKKERLDVILVSRGLFESREKAQGAIMAGLVYINGNKADKPGARYMNDVEIEVREGHMPFVSRGGFKLERAMDVFGLSLEGDISMDVGASTGGFTDCMLQKGAVKVYAVDVGYGQLAWQLRNDERVVCLERTNARYLTEKEVPDPIDFVSVDVSFISLKKIFPAVVRLLSGRGQMVCLIKPQFEAGRDKVGKNGVVRDKRVHMDVIRDIADSLPEFGLRAMGLTYSPIKGPKGNIEYLIWLRPDDTDSGAAECQDPDLMRNDIDVCSDENIKKTVEEAHSVLNRDRE